MQQHSKVRLPKACNVTIHLPSHISNVVRQVPTIDSFPFFLPTRSPHSGGSDVIVGGSGRSLEDDSRGSGV